MIREPVESKSIISVFNVKILTSSAQNAYTYTDTLQLFLCVCLFVKQHDVFKMDNNKNLGRYKNARARDLPTQYATREQMNH